jgi:hypothetical protein
MTCRDMTCRDMTCRDMTCRDMTCRDMTCRDMTCRDVAARAATLLATAVDHLFLHLRAGLLGLARVPSSCWFSDCRFWEKIMLK